jgi:hypothetical protein
MTSRKIEEHLEEQVNFSELPISETLKIENPQIAACKEITN